MTLNAKVGFLLTFLGDFGPWHTFQEQMVSKSLHIVKDNLHMKFST